MIILISLLVFLIFAGSDFISHSVCSNKLGLIIIFKDFPKRSLKFRSKSEWTLDNSNESKFLMWNTLYGKGLMVFSSINNILHKETIKADGEEHLLPLFCRREVKATCGLWNEGIKNNFNFYFYYTIPERKNFS